MRRRLPLAMRQEIRQHWRLWNDRLNGISFDHAKGAVEQPCSLGLTQPIMPSDFFESKLANITRGAALLDGGLIGINQNWSFWHRVSRPNAANGFLPGRNIVKGKLVARSGGGLCQLSSMVYHLALLGGLTVLERHPHSLDIYQEDQRFTPLGADATVVWGFKDLRLHNPHPFRVCFGFSVERDRLVGELRSEANLTARHVEFVRVRLERPWVQVNTMVNQRLQVSTVYEQKQGLQVVT
ncbi:VanW family protein [Cyanobium gracile]|uniref:VanW family protein n=1 Tax=Cyanobium gracile UHCC 0281 TaxID=3110309 RepID=A0ABU5SST7_9CYAN|nr:VanW family protein [Cyanobium gracile]MEA5441569.1 VanW family protein [Cyanobium gracile UHCC 0281]